MSFSSDVKEELTRIIIKDLDGNDRVVKGTYM